MENPYINLLKRGEWQERRLHIMERDNFECQAAGCKDRKNYLQIHHKDYWPDKKPWEYSDDLLITLCGRCHKKENARLRIDEQLLTSLKQKGFLTGDIECLTAIIYTDAKFLENLLNYLRRVQNG